VWQFSAGILRGKTGKKNLNFLAIDTKHFSLKLITFAVCSQSHQSGVSSRGSSHFYFELIDWHVRGGSHFYFKERNKERILFILFTL
jgi:hypothetical protein